MKRPPDMPKLTTSHIYTLLIALALVVGASMYVYIAKGEQRGAGTAKPSHVAVQSDFAPHKALYEIKLSSTRSGSQVINIAGQMFYEWQTTCDAWLSDHRFNMLYEYADAPPMRMISNFSTYESFDGETLQFSSQRKSDGEVIEEIRGQANGEEAIYRLPQDAQIDLPQGVLFPVSHTIQVAQHMKAGDKFYNAVIFDGSDMEGAVEVNSFIGAAAQIPASLKKQKGVDMALLESPARKVRLAFFPQKEDQVIADYEMDLVFHENGVISDMVVEYDDFSVTQTLIALEPLSSQCE